MMHFKESMLKLILETLSYSPFKIIREFSYKTIKRKVIMNKFFILILLLVASIWLGCGHSAGINFSTERLNEIIVGVTTKDQVISYFGQPVVKKTENIDSLESTFYQYYFLSAKTGSSYYNYRRNLTVELVNNIVNGYIYWSSFKDDLTSFDSDKRDQITPGKSTKNEIEKLLGKPSGVFKFPTNYYGPLSASGTIKKPPRETFDTWQYYYSKTYSKENIIMEEYKSLLLYFDFNGNLLDRAYWESTK